jgi:hypothetical protein
VAPNDLVLTHLGMAVRTEPPLEHHGGGGVEGHASHPLAAV